MKDEEKLAREFLRHHGYVDIVYEPDGKVPPDFLIDGRIAVEVRRLNQNYEAGSLRQGLEDVEIRLQQGIEKLVLSLGPPTRGQSWFIFYVFRRPIDRRATLAKVRYLLQEFINGTDHAPTNLAAGENFTLEIFPVSDLQPTFCVIGGYSDDDAGGWILPEMERNLKLA
jgi:hypothetical protein